MGKLEQGGSGVGERKYTGIIRVKNPTGGYTFYPFEGSYQVAAKAVVVSPIKMNVLYIGVDNPMKISVPGVGQGDVSASLAGAGTLSKNSDGTYTANVTGVGKCQINVSAKIEGKVQSMGSEEFRIKRIPDPVPMTSGKLRGGNVQSGTMKAQSGILALLENFDFDARFNVVSFQMVFSSKGEIFKAESPGPGFTAQMKGFIDRAKPKDIIFIDEIKVVGPDKQPRKLGQIAFTII
ncbi:MAG: GldM family protein [Chitinophagales bacterium]